MTTLAGCQVTEKIYKGNETDIFRGLLLEDRLPVVIKQMKTPHPSPEELARFRKEYEIMRMFNVEEVVKAHSLEKTQNKVGSVYAFSRILIL